MVELAAATDPALVAPTVPAAIGLRDPAAAPAEASAVRHLRARKMLLVLDNCEHVIAACASLVDGVLAGCPQVRAVATGREALRLPGEAVLSLGPLSVPRPGASAADLTASDAVRLLADRAATAAPAWSLARADPLLVANWSVASMERRWPSSWRRCACAAWALPSCWPMMTTPQSFDPCEGEVVPRLCVFTRAVDALRR